jgi:hypothetical protein
MALRMMLFQGTELYCRVKCSAPKLGLRQFHWNNFRGRYNWKYDWIFLVGVPEEPDPEDLNPIYFVLRPATLLTLIGKRNELFCHIEPKGGWKTKALFKDFLMDEQMIAAFFNYCEGPFL